jgi:hypothetical protein
MLKILTTNSVNTRTFYGKEIQVLVLHSVHSPSLWLYPLTNSLKVVTSTQDN